MIKVSLKKYLSLLFSILIILSTIDLLFIINESSKRISNSHINDMLYLKNKLIDRKINLSLFQINTVLHEMIYNQDIEFKNISPQINNIIEDIFKINVSLESLYMFHDNKADSGLLFSLSNGNIINKKINYSFYKSHWQFNEKKKYFKTNKSLFLSRKSGNIDIIFEFSNDSFFNDDIKNNHNTPYYIFDIENNEIIYSKNELNKLNVINIINEKRESFIHNNKTYNINLNTLDNNKLMFVTLIPNTIILKDISITLKTLTLKLIIHSTLILIIFVFISNYLSNKINTLKTNTDRVLNFNFKNLEFKKSIIIEINELNESIKLMSNTINDMLNNISLISKVNDIFQLGVIFEKKINNITKGKCKLYFINKDKKLISTEGIDSLSSYENKIDLFFYNSMNNESNYYFNIFNIKQEFIGCLHVNLTEKTLLPNEKINFILKLVYFASVSFQKNKLLTQQKELFNAFTHSIASAIDTKSTHTAGHCQRVPELTLMLAKAAQDNNRQWKDFSLNDDEWEELYLAAWLHDCGKLTTSDHVIDKATKLDMFTNRIHEIRTRYEVLKRDAEITYLKKLIDDKSNATLLQENYLRTIKELDEEFAFIAQSNLGDEFYHDDNIDRLHNLATRTFTRTLDKRLGLSWEETQLLSDNDKQTPSIETVLQNNSSHLIPWELNRKKDEQFNLQPQPFKFNYGEIYNLSVQRGTLTKEERFLINDHIIQTINMLKELPYPDHLKNIPLIAGGHHEQMSGKGYPYGIPASELPITARMMAIADIFEALTSNDRPYKTPKTLSESLKILAYMAKNKHIDSSLFVLFLTDGVYLNYANKFLSSEQIDSVNIEKLIKISMS